MLRNTWLAARTYRICYGMVHVHACVFATAHQHCYETHTVTRSLVTVGLVDAQDAIDYWYLLMHGVLIQAQVLSCRPLCRLIDMTEQARRGEMFEFEAWLSRGQPGAAYKPVDKYEALLDVWKCPSM